MTSQPRDKTRDSTKHDTAKFGIDLYSNKATDKVEGNYRFLAIFKIFKQFGRGRTCATFKNMNTKLFYYTIKPIANIKKLHSLRRVPNFQI